MKQFVRVIAVALLAVMVLSCVACSGGSSFGKIKADFEANGYVYVENDEGSSIFDAFTADLEEGEISCTLHLFKAETKKEDDDDGDKSIFDQIGDAVGDIMNAVDYCGVIEFASDKELKKALEESETLKGMISDAQKSDVVNGNCVLFVGINYAKQIEIFNKSK